MYCDFALRLVQLSDAIVPLGCSEIMSSPELMKETEANVASPNTHSGAVTPSAFSVVDEKDKEYSPRISSDDVRKRDSDIAVPLERIESSPYPKKFRLFSILLGLVLSIFLVALDMVSHPHLQEDQAHLR
jgi:hypothetical protein